TRPRPRCAQAAPGHAGSAHPEPPRSRDRRPQGPRPHRSTRCVAASLQVFQPVKDAAAARWQGWVSFALGLWLAMSPWICGYADDEHLATGNAAFIGIALA